MKEAKISIFKSLYKTEVPHYVSLEKALNRIKEGKSDSRIKIIQEKKTKKERDQEKKKLPSICFSGVFRERSVNGLLQHSGLMVLDFDEVEDIKKLKNKLKKNKTIVSVFVSPSGNGLKAIVRINPCDKNTHSKTFEAFEKEFNYPQLDKSGKDVSRVCFESSDPDIYINYNAEVYNPVLVEKGHDARERPATLRIDSDLKKIDLIMKWDWSKDFREGERNHYIFDLAGAFCEYGVDPENAKQYIANNVIHGDFSEKEAFRTIDSAYKSRSFGCKYFEDYQKIDKIKSDLKHGKTKVLKKYEIDEELFEKISEEADNDDFWNQTFVKSTGESKIKVDPLKYKYFLERHGFKKTYPNNSDKVILVKIESNKVQETSPEKIKDFVLDYLMERKELAVWRYCSNYQNLFSESFLTILETIELTMLSDTRTTSFVAFTNGILKVTKSKCELIDYIDIDCYIWKKHIIDRPFIPVDDDHNDYKKFIQNVSHDSIKPLQSVIGYLLCTYKNKTNNKAIIFNDEVISENPEGGTGKGLIMQGLKEIRKVSILDGKAFDDKQSFPYQTVNQETQILVFDDVKKNFDFESKFSLVTEGMTLERKGKDAIKLSVEESPKIVITTNYAIKGDGNSHRRRRHEVEIAQYYGPEREPVDEFKRQLFSEWNEDDFKRFDNFMINCLQVYLKEGLIKQNAKNLRRRSFISSTSPEFEVFCTEGGIKTNKIVHKKDLFNQLLDDYPDLKRWLTQRRFTMWVKKWASYNRMEYQDGVTNGIQWFEIKEKEKKVKNEKDDEFGDIEEPGF